MLNDSIHQIIDSSTFVIALIAIRLSKTQRIKKWKSGQNKVEIYGALICNVILICLMIFLLIESVKKIIEYKL